MSDFKFSCPHCQQHLEAPEEMAGATIDCPHCKQRISVPLDGGKGNATNADVRQFVNQDPSITPNDIVFECPHCGKSLAIDKRGAGIQIQCPDCSHAIIVPAPATNGDELPASPSPVFIEESQKQFQHNMEQMQRQFQEAKRNLYGLRK